MFNGGYQNNFSSEFANDYARWNGYSENPLYDSMSTGYENPNNVVNQHIARKEADINKDNFSKLGSSLSNISGLVSKGANIYNSFNTMNNLNNFAKQASAIGNSLGASTASTQANLNSMAGGLAAAGLIASFSKNPYVSGVGSAISTGLSALQGGLGMASAGIGTAINLANYFQQKEINKELRNNSNLELGLVQDQYDGVKERYDRKQNKMNSIANSINKSMEV